MMRASPSIDRVETSPIEGPECDCFNAKLAAVKGVAGTGVRIAARRRALVVLVLVATFGWSLLTFELLNDHFDRISRGRQILVYGDRPFVDFRDPGYFLTLYASAAAQAASGGSLLGEAVIDSAGIAVAVALTFLLAARAAQSTGIGLVAAAFAVVVAPRYYDYDKVRFYTSGLALAWRYADRRGFGTIIAVSVVTAVAGLFRYDNGLFLFAGTVATLVACHWREPRTLTRRTTVYGTGVVVALAPAAIAWQQSLGLSAVVRQIQTYAQVEGARTDIFTPPRLMLETGRSAIFAIANPQNYAALLYYAIVALLPIASVCLIWRAARPRREKGMANEIPKIAAVVVLGVLVAAFILRNPVVARLGAAAPIAAILAAWMMGLVVPAREARRHARPLAIILGGAVTLWLALTLTGHSPAHWRQLPQLIVAGPTWIRELARSPPNSTMLPDDGASEGMARYLRECTPPRSRVLVDGFVPEVYFFAERGFAGGTPVFFGGHWSSQRDQERTIEQLRREFVPLAIVATGFASEYDRVSEYLSTDFDLAGISSFDSPRAPAGGYHVLLRRGIGSPPIDSRWNLPCLSDWVP